MNSVVNAFGHYEKRGYHGIAMEVTDTHSWCMEKVVMYVAVNQLS
jgi:hypothetical protein